MTARRLSRSAPAPSCLRTPALRSRAHLPPAGRQPKPRPGGRFRQEAPPPPRFRSEAPRRALSGPAERAFLWIGCVAAAPSLGGGRDFRTLREAWCPGSRRAAGVVPESRRLSSARAACSPAASPVSGDGARDGTNFGPRPPGRRPADEGKMTRDRLPGVPPPARREPGRVGRAQRAGPGTGVSDSGMCYFLSERARDRGLTTRSFLGKKSWFRLNAGNGKAVPGHCASAEPADPKPTGRADATARAVNLPFVPRATSQASAYDSSASPRETPASRFHQVPQHHPLSSSHPEYPPCRLFCPSGISRLTWVPSALLTSQVHGCCGQGTHCSPDVAAYKACPTAGERISAPRKRG
ncbi:uncharacterized protein LOC123585796 [Leopardus geoffroyi]|uniref:uncharacterized protein LOC123585796 n=1 Tax=Leopardus geoffroyi TaxID=46844 RepID=UPI001E262E00|nr:uncharacterized protein LOC123585796 [Leopardus geoffroyi]